MLMDKQLCADKEGEGSGSRTLPHNTMEPLASSAEELALDCAKTQALLQPASIQIGGQTPQAADNAVLSSAQSSWNLYIKTVTTPGGMKQLKGKTSSNQLDRWKSKRLEWLRRHAAHHHERASRNPSVEMFLERGSPVEDQPTD
jgi:hypothetical protein